MSVAFGQPHPRIDGPAKVRGLALYASDEAVRNPAWAFLITSAIARGRVTAFDMAEALALPGVIDILTHENVGEEAKPPKQQSGGDTTTTMQEDRVWHDGQIIGVVLADTYEIARDAAFRVRVHYHEEAPSATFGSPGAKEEVRDDGEHKDYSVGDVDAALASAEVTVSRHYGTPIQHHNPIELFTTTAEWNGGELTVHEPSQFVYGLRANVAGQLGIDPARVRVISRFVGGAFGAKGGATARTAWIAVAARRVNRPVKLVSTRDQGYTIATYRAETRHQVRLGATRDGKLTALVHQGWEVTSRPSSYNVSGTDTTARMYACPNIRTAVNIVHADRNTPGFMRAPPDTPYLFALECAMDELAQELGIDPIELRRCNDTQVDPVSGLPFSSRHLIECLDQGAERFGWSARDPRPRTMRDGDWLVGWGCASAAYGSNIASTAARVTLRPDGHALVQIAAHDIGQGAYTVAAMTVAQTLGLELAQVAVEFGDTTLPPASLAAGSSHTATITHAITKACDELVARLRAAGAKEGEPLHEAVARVTNGALEAHAEHIPEGLGPESMVKLYRGAPPRLRGPGREDVTPNAVGAQFAEVRVHRLTCEVRVPRMVGAFAAGTIVNPLTAHSQYVGGMIWGLGAALEEKTEIDGRHARYVNDNLSEYHIPVNADVARVEVVMVPERDDRVNPLGIKGLGEIGIVGMNAAIANAVWHATGRRVRTLPIRIEDLL